MEAPLQLAVASANLQNDSIDFVQTVVVGVRHISSCVVDVVVAVVGPTVVVSDETYEKRPPSLVRLMNLV